MTDNDIIKALGCCAVAYDCIDCPFDCDCGNMSNLSTAVLDLINRQKAEIERLKETKDRLLYNLKAVCEEKDEDNVRAEAIKEFEKRLKEKKHLEEYSVLDSVESVYVEDVDNLVREMVGDDNG